MEIKKENVINAYMIGDNNAKEMLQVMFPDIDFKTEKQVEKISIIEQVKTFEDACRILGSNNPFVVTYKTIHIGTYLENKVEKGKDLTAYLKLRIICAALNEGWEPQFVEDELR